MTDEKKKVDVKETADSIIRETKAKSNNSQFIIWMGALVLGAILGWMGIPALNEFFNFVATVFTRLFQFIAVPTIALAVITTLAALGGNKETGIIFAHAVTYTLLTTFLAAFIGLGLYIYIAPDNLPADIVNAGSEVVKGQSVAALSYYDHILGVIPNNVLAPFLSGNVLSVMLIAAAVGLALAFMPRTENREAILKVIQGVQEGNAIQFFIVLPIILVLRGLNPIYVMRQMGQAIAVALFTKSSAGTLPVTLACSEENLKVNPKVSRFVLPICTTINMNGCAAFILVTSLFIMQNAGFELTMTTMLTWVCIAVLAAIGNAGVPMGCYFLTLSLMAGIGAPIGLMGIILPIYTIIDMIETAENVWSDACVCAMVDHDLKGKLSEDGDIPAAL